MTTEHDLPHGGERGTLVDRSLAGDRRALARAISRIERDDEAGRALVDLVYPHTGQAHRVGITGQPGAGKSSLIAKLIAAFRALDRRVGVICVDPTSPFTGGATLGDRVRLMEFHADLDVYVRSMASRGHHGGLAATTTAVAHLLDAAGFDPILIETLGVGQDEVEIANLTHTVVVLQVPGLGDTVQTLKAGLLEIADVLAVNKADLPEADRLFRDLAAMLSLAERPRLEAWSVKLVRTSATTGAGADQLVEAIRTHRRWLEETGAWHERQRQLAAAELSTLLRRSIEERARSAGTGDGWPTIVEEIAGRKRSPGQAAMRLISDLDLGAVRANP